MIPTLHFNGPVWRPPYESTAQLLQVTAGCTWHRCKFCTLYGQQRFRMSPVSEIESDLRIIKRFQPRARRIFLTGANPFVLTTDKLAYIAQLIRRYISEGQPTIGCFARVTDIADKSVDNLRLLHQLGYDYITIGVESGDSDTLTRVNKGYVAEDILIQLHKLDEAGIRYNLFYLAGLAGAGNSKRNAMRSAELFSKLSPVSIGILSLTLFPESELYKEVQDGLFKEASEHERLDEIMCLVRNLQCRTHILGRTVSNPVPFTGYIPTDRQMILDTLSSIRSSLSEQELRDYRDGIVSL